MLERFYWVIDGILAGSSRPGGTRGDVVPETLERDLLDLRREGIRAVLTLTENPLPALTAPHAMEFLHLPIPDMDAPHRGQFMEALAFLDAQRLAERAAAVHCLMGQGRTGTILAAYLIRGGATADEAIARLRALCTGAIESPRQVVALHAFARQADWML
jgi:atypical dual specificity phosphatase